MDEAVAIVLMFDEVMCDYMKVAPVMTHLGVQGAEVGGMQIRGRDVALVLLVGYLQGKYIFWYKNISGFKD